MSNTGKICEKLTADIDDFGNLGAEMSYLQSQMHSDCDSAQSIADSDLEDGELRKCWLHHCIRRVDGIVNPLECQSHRGNLLHCYRKEEQVQSELKLI